MPVIAASPSPRRRKKAPPQIAARADALPFADGSLDAVLAAGIPAEGLEALHELARVVRDGGVVALATATSALVRKVAAPETLAAAFVHAALVDIEQKPAGSLLLTWGRVRHFPS
jgi:ubiquinone/menaquinone biosynthesis C-methylase UbiE